MEQQRAQHHGRPQATTLSRTVAENAARDLIRARAVELGLAARPDRDLREKKKLAPLRGEPWKLELAIAMAWFARSSDVSAETWNYPALERQLADRRAPLPEGLSIRRAVSLVYCQLEELDPKWHKANIETPMGWRISSVMVGTPTVDGEPDSGAWIAATTDDRDALTSATLLVDFGLARRSLSNLALDNRAQAAEAQEQELADRAAAFADEAEILEAAALAAAELAGYASGRELEARIRELEPEGAPRHAGFILDAALSVNPTRAGGPQGDEFLDAIARVLVEEALRRTAPN